ncbi:MAG TPA: glycosyltransferase family 2 protein [Pyrinomonadaceae bacterium]
MLISVVVPCYNEEPVIRETHKRLVSVLEQLKPDAFEIVYVNDGSRDRTLELLEELQATDERVRVLSFSRNFGHQIAVTAGLDHAQGEAVVLIDADLQDPPAVILEMVERWRDGYHVVYGMRTDRPGETRFKLWTAKLFYRLLNRLADVEIPLDVGDFRLMDRRVVDVMRAMPERDRYLRGMVSWVGFRQIAVMYRREPRFAGESKYPLFKMLRFATDGIISFSNVPLRLAVWAGVFAIFLAFGGIIYALVLRLYFSETHWVRGWTSTFVAILFLGGTQLIFLGFIGEYIGRIYGEVKRRPLYILQERLGFEKEAEEKQQGVDVEQVQDLRR